LKGIQKYSLIFSILAVFLSAAFLSVPDAYADEEANQSEAQNTETSKTSNEGAQYIKDSEKEPGINLHLGSGLKAFFSVDLPKGDKTEEMLSNIRDDMDFTNYRALFGLRIPL